MLHTNTDTRTRYYLSLPRNKTNQNNFSSEFGSEIMLTPGQAGPIRETETKG
jgi:hypothetical protein